MGWPVYYAHEEDKAGAGGLGGMGGGMGGMGGF